MTTGRNMVDFRFPVQCVLRPHGDFRGFAGRVLSGTIAPGEPVAILPSGQTTRVKAIETYDGRPIAVKGVKGRYVRLYSNGNTSDELNHYTEVEVYGKPVN